MVINYKIKKKPKTFTVTPGCYSPRNAILFLDENNKIINYIEICFQCHQFFQMPEATIPDFNVLCQIEECSGMIGLFKDFFISNGIINGVEKVKFSK